LKTLKGQFFSFSLLVREFEIMNKIKNKNGSFTYETKVFISGKVSTLTRIL